MEDDCSGAKQWYLDNEGVCGGREGVLFGFGFHFVFQMGGEIEKYQKDVLVRGVMIVAFIWIVLLPIQVSLDDVLRICKLF